MIVAFVGCINNESLLPISGCGKTCGMTGYAYLNYLRGKKIITNYKTDFSTTEGLQKTVEYVNEKIEDNTIAELADTVICTTEIQKILDAIGSTKKQTLFIDSFAAQLRKTGIDWFWDTQRFNTIQIRLRIHTDMILIPYKTHMDNKSCSINNCKAEHKIFIYSHKPYNPKWIKCFIAAKVGMHYDSHEFINDSLHLIGDKL